MTDPLKIIDQNAAAVQKTPNRVTLDFIKERVSNVEYINPLSKPSMTLALVTHVNGFTVVGMSSPGDPANFNAELGKTGAYNDAIKQLWAHEAFAMCERLSEGPTP